MEPICLPSAPFRRREALALGFDDAALRRLVRRGFIVRVRHGVYVDSRDPALAGDAWARHRLAVVAAAEALTNVVASHQSAAALWGLPVLGPPPSVPRFTRHGSRGTPDATPGARVSAAGVAADEVAMVDGVLVTSLARTAVDLARELSFRDAVVSADAALRRGATPADLQASLASATRWPGAAAAGKAVAFADGRAESPHESITRVALVQLGFPVPELQVTLGDSCPIGRVDHLYRAQRTVVESDGMLKYTDPAVLRAEKIREDLLRDFGLEVVRVLWQEALHPGPLLRDRVARAFARGARLGPWPGRLPA